MKKGLLIACAVLYVAMCSMLVLACENEISETDDGSNTIAFNKACMELCAKNRQPGMYEITKDCADCMKKNYRKEDKNKQMEGLKLMQKKGIRGFNIQVAELQEMLDTLKAHGGGNVYAMLAVRDTIVIEEKKRKEKLIPELVFQMDFAPMKNKVDGDDNDAGSGNQYFDFTRPCPDWCPKID